MVAKTYKNSTIVGEPYEVNHKLYVDIILKTGEKKKVRWYSEAEYKTIYEENTEFANLKSTLGFDKGYITVFKGETYAQMEWFKQRPECKFSNIWGWYITSDYAVPSDIPNGIKTFKLRWDVIAINDEHLKPEAEIKQAIEKALYSEKIGAFVGKVGDAVDADFTIQYKKLTQGYYGINAFYVLNDKDGNIYTWSTSANTCLIEGEKYHLIGKIKDLVVYKDRNTNVLTRCKIIED